DNLKSSLAAVISLDEDVFKAWVAAEGIKTEGRFKNSVDPLLIDLRLAC
ncbi:hypothetical protein Tco_0784025, partial [Tanacetum coccineum]